MVDLPLRTHRLLRCSNSERWTCWPLVTRRLPSPGHHYLWSGWFRRLQQRECQLLRGETQQRRSRDEAETQQRRPRFHSVVTRPTAVSDNARGHHKPKPTAWLLGKVEHGRRGTTTAPTTGVGRVWTGYTGMVHVRGGRGGRGQSPQKRQRRWWYQHMKMSVAMFFFLTLSAWHQCQAKVFYFSTRSFFPFPRGGFFKFLINL